MFKYVQILHQMSNFASGLLQAHPPHQYKLADKRREHSPTENNLGVLMDGKLAMSQQHIF